MMNDDFCVFILSHGRADNVITARTLERSGYTGRTYVVIDNLDKRGDRYRERFGADRVLTFDKPAEAEHQHWRIHHHVRWENCAPKILSERWRKGKGVRRG